MRRRLPNVSSIFLPRDFVIADETVARAKVAINTKTDELRYEHAKPL